MKEIKVYVDELPESCFDCHCAYYGGCVIDTGNVEDFDNFDWSERRAKHCPLIDIKTHDEEKDKQIKELEQKVQELQELDNKRAFRLYCMLYDMLEEQDPENVASRIDFMTSENYADIFELYKTAKNIKTHDRELVKEVLKKVKKIAFKSKVICDKTGLPCFGEMRQIYGIYDYELDQIQKEFEK